MSTLRAPSASLTLPMASSAVLHVAILGFILYRAATPAKPLPPLYRVELIAAAAGPRAEGVVTSAPAPEVPTKAPPAPEKRTTTSKVAAKKVPKTKTPPAKAATPNITQKSTPQPTTAPPKAGGGEQGGAGTDVASVLSPGIAFPFPGYLSNVVRQVALQFEVPRGAQSLTADVIFLIHRDGTVTGIRLISKSGSYVFDQSCLAAVEAAGRSGKFNRLPDGFTDDVLPVIFSFDPKRMR